MNESRGALNRKRGDHYVESDSTHLVLSDAMFSRKDYQPSQLSGKKVRSGLIAPDVRDETDRCPNEA